MKIKPKLYLNMSPQTAEEGSLAFARNMKIDDDGNLVSDYGYKNIAALSDKTIVGHIVGLDNKIYFFCHTLVSGSYQDKIVEYDENLETATVLTTQWTYGGGEIDGHVNTNQSGEKILTIGEYLANGSSIPLKHINLKYANVEESLYSQAPKCPTANLVLNDTYVKTIPNGVYVFFIRYKIRKDVYTNWFLCSRPIFSGTSEQTTTLQGGLKYVNTHKDSAKSFVFQLSFVQKANIDSYKEFQLGFVITHDEATDARSWKHFKTSDFKTSGGSIYFDYEDVEDANIDDLFKTTYELYNVRNITSFKNKLYISNYIESDFNPVLTDLVSCINVGYSEEQNTSPGVQNQVSITGVTLGSYTFGTNDVGYYSASIAQSTIKNLLDFSISDFYKIDSYELENALTLTLFGRSDNDPDIIYINGLVNNLYNNLIFGNDFTIAYNSDGDGWHDIGINTSPISGVDPTIKAITSYGSGHPLYGIITFAYGLFGEISIPSAYSTYAEANIIPINSTTIQAAKAIAGASFMTDEIKSTIARLVEKDIKNLDRLILGYATITNGAKKYVIDLTTYGKSVFEKNDFIGDLNTVDYGIENVNNTLDSNITDVIKNTISAFVSANLSGVDDNGNLVIYYDNDYIKLNAIEFTFKSCEFKLDGQNYINTNNEQIYNCTFNATLKATSYNCFCTFNIKDSVITITPSDISNDMYKQKGTLMPLSKYKAYVHFVDDRNIITNGYPISGTINTPGNLYSDLSKFKLTYTVSNSVDTYKENYKSFFISLKNVGDIIIESFAPSYKNGYNIVNVLEADTLLYGINDNITVIKDDGTVIATNAKYYSSSISTPSLAFGNCGYIAWKGEQYNGRVYIKIERNINEEEQTSLIKATPYIELSAGNGSVSDGFYGSYFCSVKKPSFSLSSGCYVSGTDIYSATRENVIKLKEFDGYINLQDSTLHFIRSNFNLNYLTLTEDIVDRIHRVSNNIKDIKQPIKIINSATLSYIYELKSMYKDFSNKLFRKYDTDYKIDFDNTVRVSHVLSDETFNNSIFKFDAEDYYNIPTDRGVIVNLFAIGSNIFVHTETAFYKFDGNQTIAASDKDITLQESEPFETGVTQLFDSEYGYGGIHNKEAGCITFDSYIFYDAMSNHIFAYGGNSQVQLIDASIYKLLCYYKPTYCRTLHDDANHRVFFEFTTNTAGTYKTFTISYNYKSKSFVSLHDLSLEKAFHSRYLSYSYRNGLSRLFVQTTNIDNTVLNQDMNIYKIYGEASTVCFIQFGADTQEVQSSPFNIAVVIFPKETYRESFNSLKYIGDVVKDNYDEKTNYEVIKFPQVTRTNPVSKFYVITDKCVSTPVTGDINDAQRPANPDDYKGFKYDMGSWNTNYFRNALDDTNIYKYPNQPGVNEPIAGGQTYTRHPNTDNNSLVYGKYFILVFDFIKNKPIKIEEVSVNSNQY